MNKYLVTVNEDAFTTYMVEAKDKEEAEDKALIGEYLCIDEEEKISKVILSKEYNDK